MRLWGRRACLLAWLLWFDGFSDLQSAAPCWATNLLPILAAADSQRPACLMCRLALHLGLASLPLRSVLHAACLACVLWPISWAVVCVGPFCASRQQSYRRQDRHTVLSRCLLAAESPLRFWRASHKEGVSSRPLHRKLNQGSDCCCCHRALKPRRDTVSLPAASVALPVMVSLILQHSSGVSSSLLVHGNVCTPDSPTSKTACSCECVAEATRRRHQREAGVAEQRRS